MNLAQKYQTILGPHVTEKTVRIADAQEKQITLKVLRTASKAQIKGAVEALFEVKVSKVRVANMKPKTRRVGKISGKTKAWKKAYVSLQKGFDIQFGDGVE
jgi:large subunit ribosomal protein L23